MGSKAGQAPLPRDVAFGDSCSGSEEGCGLLQDSLGAGLGAPDGSTAPCWTAGCVCDPRAAILFQDGSLQSSKPELIPAGVFKKCWGHFSPPVPSLYCGTLCGSLGIKIFGQCVCVFALWAQSCSILSSLKFYGKQRQNQTSLA